MIKKIKSSILASIKNKKINVFFLFLLLSFIILIFTKLSKTYTNTLVFNIEKINVPQEYIIVNDTLSLNLTLKTHGFKWLAFYFNKPKIKIDFKKDVKQKDSVFVWSKPKEFLENTQFDSQVQLLNVSPEELHFRYSVNRVKKLPIKLNADIQFSLGFDISKPYVLKPDSVIVIGPETLVSKLDFIQTEKVILQDVRENIQKTVRLKLPKKDKLVRFSNDKIQLNGTVEKFTEGTLNIPVTIINIPEGINLKFFPKEVNVSYYVSLNNFNAISPLDFKIVCDYSSIINNQSILIPQLVKSPDVVKNIKIKQKRIEFIILK